MDWTIDKSRSICRQICEKICLAISVGEFKAGAKIFSVREVALLSSVNPNTVQKAYNELEKEGVIYSIPSSGWYVCEDTDAASKEIKILIDKNCEEYLIAMERFGIGTDAAIEYLKLYKKGTDTHE